MIRPVCYLCLLCLGLWSCGGDSPMNFEARQNAFGKAGSLMVIADSAYLAGAGLDSVDYYFGAAYPILPQPEPIHDLRFFHPDHLIHKPAHKLHRAYLIIADLSDISSPATQMVIKDIGEESLRSGFGGKTYQLKTGKDKWADHQLLFYIIGRDREGVYDGIRASMTTFSERLYDFDKKQYQANLFVNGPDKGIESVLEQKFGVRIPIPERFAIGVEEDHFIWIQDYIPKVTGGLILHRAPYNAEHQFDVDSVLSLRDQLTSKYVQGPTEGSYMVVNRRDLPTFHYTKTLGGQYTREVRGIWEMKNEFMGGSYISYLIRYPNAKEVLFVDIFVYGPGQEKREALKHLIHLVDELEFI